MVLKRGRRSLRTKHQHGQTLLRRLATPDSASLCTRGRDAGATSPALPSQFGLCRENSWSATAHGADGTGSASSRTQAQVHRADTRAVAWLVAAATGLHPGRVAGKTGSGETFAGECALAVGGAGQDRLAVEKKALPARERDTGGHQKRRPAFPEPIPPARAGKADVLRLRRKRSHHPDDSHVGPGPARRTDRRGHAARPLESADPTGHDEPAR